MTDTIADLLVRIKNAYLAHHEQVILPSSKIKLAIAQVLQEAGYLLEVKEATRGFPFFNTKSTFFVNCYNSSRNCHPLLVMARYLPNSY